MDGGGTSVENFFTLLQADCIPYTYFAPDLQVQLNEISALIGSLDSFPDRTVLLLSVLTALQGFQSEIHQKQRSLSAGYDSLMFFSAVLMASAFVIIVFKRLKEKAQAERIQAVSDKQLSFS